MRAHTHTHTDPRHRARHRVFAVWRAGSQDLWGVAGRARLCVRAVLSDPDTLLSGSRLAVLKSSQALKSQFQACASP
eukprot:scaffold117804_cov18-Tisochrysis_lutea.AAC.1